MRDIAQPSPTNRTRRKNHARLASRLSFNEAPSEQREKAMTDTVVDDIVALLPPLLQSLEALQFVARYLHPPAFGEVMDKVGAPDEALLAACTALRPWPDSFADLRGPLDAACAAALAGF
eukprot:gene30682-40795_t